MDAKLLNGTTRNLSESNEAFSMVIMELSLKRQSFYYVFNLVFPTTLVSLVAVIGFHAPINATGRRESKFRLGKSKQKSRKQFGWIIGIMTLLSMSVMLLMLVGEMKFAMESVPGQRGSFSDVPLLGKNILKGGISKSTVHTRIKPVPSVYCPQIMSQLLWTSVQNFLSRP